MAENKQFITQIQDNGTVLISEDVVSTIVAHSVEEVEGVAGLSNANKKSWGKSMKIVIAENNLLTIDCNINVIYGNSVVNVASAVQEAITGAVSSMTGVKVNAVNINVCGIIRK